GRAGGGASGAGAPRGARYRVAHSGWGGAPAAPPPPPAGPYRGVARPATTFVMERLLDLGAAALGLDPVEVRRVNLVGPADLPYTSATRLVHDSATYGVCFEKVVEAVGYEAFRAAQARLR